MGCWWWARSTRWRPASSRFSTGLPNSIEACTPVMYVRASYDSAAYKAQLEETARKPGKVVRDEGDAEKALGSAAKTIFAEYYAPHLAHAPMEPTCATARVAGGKCEVWAAVASIERALLGFSRADSLEKSEKAPSVALPESIIPSAGASGPKLSNHRRGTGFAPVVLPVEQPAGCHSHGTGAAGKAQGRHDASSAGQTHARGSAF